MRSKLLLSKLPFYNLLLDKKMNHFHEASKKFQHSNSSEILEKSFTLFSSPFFQNLQGDLVFNLKFHSSTLKAKNILFPRINLVCAPSRFQLLESFPYPIMSLRPPIYYLIIYLLSDHLSSPYLFLPYHVTKSPLSNSTMYNQESKTRKCYHRT